MQYSRVSLSLRLASIVLGWVGVFLVASGSPDLFLGTAQVIYVVGALPLAIVTLFKMFIRNRMAA